MGASGSGKSAPRNVLGLCDDYDECCNLRDGREMARLGEPEAAPALASAGLAHA